MSGAGAVEIRTRKGGCLLRVRVSAGAARDGVRGAHDGALKLSVRTAPERGKANRAVLDLLAGLLDIPTSRLHIARGETTRDKQVHVDGLDADALRSRLERILSARGPSA